MSSVAEILEGKRICVCAGAGGVGKTTTSAAIALGMAARGLKVAVVTIDPARRLANALGLEQLENTPRLVPPERLRAAAGSGARELEVRGELWAMMLDSKRTFDELIDRLATDPERAAEIKRNGVYREVSSAVSGSQEFTAVSKLYELVRDDDYDLLVLDTPPSRNALDFLDAPGRLTSFLEGRALRAFLRPSGLGLRMIGRGTGVVMAAMRRVTGVDLIADLSAFFGLLGGMTEDFSERAREVESLLRAETTAFILVTSAQPEPIEEALWFRRTLAEQGLPFAAAVVNRFHHDLLGATEGGQLEVEQAVRELVPLRLARAVAENLGDYHVLAERDRRGLERLRGALGSEPAICVPHLDEDVHDVGGLLAMHRWLFAGSAQRDRMLLDVVA